MRTIFRGLARSCDRSLRRIFAIGICLLGSNLAAAPVILNEYNAVGDSRYLATDDFAGSTNGDSIFGRVPGNGGDWFELVVTTNRVNLRGWTLEWAYAKDAANHGSGTLRLADVAVLTDLRAGTILTVIEQPSAQGGFDTDLSYNPAAGDWWINLCAADPAALTTDGVVTDNSVSTSLAPGVFRVNNDDWSLTLRDRAGALVFGPAGEGSPEWRGPGINGNEVAMLRAEPSILITPGSAYLDGVTSTFGAPNSWAEGQVVQDFSLLRADELREFRLIALEFLSPEAGWRVSWNSAAGVPYLLQRRHEDDLGGVQLPLWIDVAHVRPTESEVWADDRGAGAVRQRFYRVLEPPPAPPEAIVNASIPSGCLEHQGAVTLSTPAAPAVIHYTTDGREPTLDDPVLASPYPLSSTTALRAAAFVPGYQPGPIASYLWVMSNRFDLPVVALMTSPSNLFDPGNGIYVYPHVEGVYWERPASLIVLSNPILPTLDTAVGIEITGGASADNPKKSFAVKWRSRFGDASLDVPLFPQQPHLYPFTDVTLRCGGTDSQVATWSLIRDPLAHALYADLGGAASACEFVHLYLNHAYWGVYTLRERVNEDFLRRRFGVAQADLIKLEDEQPQVIAGGLEGWTQLNEFFESNDFTTAAGLTAAEQRLDLDAFTDYQLLGIYAGNLDWPHNNLFAWRSIEPSARWQPILWDVDISFGLPWWGTEASPFDHAAHNTLAWATRDSPRPDLAPPWLAAPDGREAQGTLLWSTLHLRRLLENADYRLNFINRCADLLNTTLAPDAIIARVNAYETLLSDSMSRETERWDKTGAHPGQWAENLETIRAFAQERPDRLRGFMLEQFGLPGLSTVHVTVEGAAGNAIKLGSIASEATPETGVYFVGVPIRLEALPAAGHRFVHWQFDVNETITSPVYSWTPHRSTHQVTAVFTTADHRSPSAVSAVFASP